MRGEIVTAAMQIATSANMTGQEIDFRRGAIWAAHQLVDLPARLRTRFETEVALSLGKDDRPDAPALNPDDYR